MRAFEIRLKPWESGRLRRLRDRGASPRIVKRVICLLLSAAGDPAQSTARATGWPPDAVTDIRRRRRRFGRPPRVTGEYGKQLLRALRRRPAAFE